MNDDYALDMNVDKGELRLTLPPRILRLFVNGSLQGEFFKNSSCGPEDLAGEIRAARAAKAACSMLNRTLEELREQSSKPDHLVPAAKRSVAFAAGLESGLCGGHRVIHDAAGGVVVLPEEPSEAAKEAGRAADDRWWDLDEVDPEVDWMEYVLRAAYAAERREQGGKDDTCGLGS